MFFLLDTKKKVARMLVYAWMAPAFLHLNEPNKNVAKVLNSLRLEGVSAERW